MTGHSVVWLPVQHASTDGDGFATVPSRLGDRSVVIHVGPGAFVGHLCSIGTEVFRIKVVGSDGSAADRVPVDVRVGLIEYQSDCRTQP